MLKWTGDLALVALVLEWKMDEAITHFTSFFSIFIGFGFGLGPKQGGFQIVTSIYIYFQKEITRYLPFTGFALKYHES